MLKQIVKFAKDFCTLYAAQCHERSIRKNGKSIWQDESGDIGSVIGVGASLLGSALGGSSASSAAGAQAQAAQNASATQLAMFGQNMNNQMPWLSQGGAAVNELGYLMGLTPQYPQVNSMLQPYVGNYSNGGPGGQGGQGGAAGGAGGMGGYGVNAGTAFGGSSATLPYGPGQTPSSWTTPFGPVERSNTGDLIGNASAQAWLVQNGMGGQGGSGGAGGAGGVGSNPLYPNGQPVGSTPAGGFGSLAQMPSSPNVLLQQDPGYQFMLQQGMQALKNNQAAMGSMGSGEALKAMSNYAQGAASGEYGNAYNRYVNNQTNLYNRLAGISGTGQNTASNLGQAATATGQGVATTQQAYGNALAGGIMGQNYYTQTGLGQLANSFAPGGGMSNMFSGGGFGSLFGGGGGGGSSFAASDMSGNIGPGLGGLY
jgi:hypothetical protein